MSYIITSEKDRTVEQITFDHGAENMSESVVKERILKRLEMIKTKFS